MNANTGTADNLTGCPVCVYLQVFGDTLRKHRLGNLIFLCLLRIFSHMCSPLAHCFVSFADEPINATTYGNTYN